MRLPNVGLQTASTIGLQSNFSEYGYDANEKTPICPYDKCGFNKNGTDPVARPIGIPCRKYNTTNSKKFRLSVCGRFWKLVVARPGVCGVTGIEGSSSRVKESRDMRRFARVEEDSGGVSRLRISMLLFIFSRLA